MFRKYANARRKPADDKGDGGFLTGIWQGYRNSLPGGGPEMRLKVLIPTIMAAARPYDAHHACGRYEIRPRLGLIKSPTLLMSGSRDLMLNELESTKSIIPRCRTQVIQGGGIYIGLEYPKEFAKAVDDFMKNPQV